jgi:deoxycytidylate deaminase
MNFDKIIEISHALAGKKKHYHRCRHFSFILDGNRILSIGVNNPKTHPYNLNFNYINKQKNKISHIVGTHSEVSAVLKYGKNCKNLILINTRINRKNELDYSRPCNGCLDMILSLDFKKVFYTNKFQQFSQINLNDLAKNSHLLVI